MGLGANLANLETQTQQQRIGLMTDSAAARAGGWVGAANARGQGMANLAGLGMAGASLAMGVPPAGLMGGQAASNVVQPQGVGATQATMTYGY